MKQVSITDLNNMKCSAIKSYFCIVNWEGTDESQYALHKIVLRKIMIVTEAKSKRQ